MNEVLHANIFFFITGISVIIVTVFFCVGLFHVIKALKAVRRILNRVEEGTEAIAEEISNARTYFFEEGLLPRLIKKIMGRHDERQKKETRQKRTEKGKTEL